MSTRLPYTGRVRDLRTVSHTVEGPRTNNHDAPLQRKQIYRSLRLVHSHFPSLVSWSTEGSPTPRPGSETPDLNTEWVEDGTPTEVSGGMTDRKTETKESVLLLVGTRSTVPVILSEVLVRSLGALGPDPSIDTLSSPGQKEDSTTDKFPGWRNREGSVSRFPVYRLRVPPLSDVRFTCTDHPFTLKKTTTSHHDSLSFRGDEGGVGNTTQ